MQWLMHIISLEVEIRKIMVLGQLRQKVRDCHFNK
jgi:hypothetical protein